MRLNNKYNLTILITFLIIVFSCEQNNQKNNYPVKTDNVKNNDYTVGSKNEIDEINVKSILEKLENKEELSEPEYNFLIDFILQNQNESYNEGFGYLLFEYFRKNDMRNNIFMSILNKNYNSKKNEILSNMVGLMCIDLEEEDYNYEKLTSEFKIFSTNESAKDALKRCIENSNVGG